MVFYVTPWEYLDLLTHNLKVAGSNPAPATKNQDVIQLVSVFFNACHPTRPRRIALHPLDLPALDKSLWPGAYHRLYAKWCMRHNLLLHILPLSPFGLNDL
jgi:hypothetical protein